MPSLMTTADKYEILEGIKYPYGTAGFRMRADLMEPVTYRVGILAAALSNYYDGQIVGIMLTASHNQVQDNGVKIVTPDGGMLSSKWECIAEEMAHSPLSNLEAVMTKSVKITPTSSIVAVGRDTRPSGETLFEAIKAGAVRIGAKVIDLGLVTTPELHMAIAKLNKMGPDISSLDLEEYYLDHLSTQFYNIVQDNDNMTNVIVDCSNGIGARKMIKLSDKLASLTGLALRTINNGSGILNEGCGADFIKTTKCPPKMEGISPSSWEHFAALDGDADRLVYFTFDDQKQFILVDGDRIGALFSLTFTQLLRESGLYEQIKFGVVQTAYANGAATEFIKQLGVKIVCTSTGVKHLHKTADEFDIGVYFEANGHGTVLCNRRTMETLNATKHPSAEKIQRLVQLANELVGDGIADLLLVEAMLKLMNITIKQWTELYTDRPSCLLKISVKDRTMMITDDADRRIVQPPDLQTEIDCLVRSIKDGRAFARASGTEDVIRIYAEASNQADADSLANKVASIMPKYL